MADKEKCGCDCTSQQEKANNENLNDEKKACGCGEGAESKCECEDNKEACDGETDENLENGASDEANTGDAGPSPEEVESERYMRLMAEFQNYKRRSEKERNDIYAYANEKLISELLNVADNFERALASDTDANEGFVKGMEMIFKQLNDVMTKAGVEEIKALGEDFDPNFHNAVMMEDSEEYKSGKVSAVLQKGYTLNGKVIRPSMVKVAN